MDSSVSAKDEIWFLRVYHHVSNAVYYGFMRRHPQLSQRQPQATSLAWAQVFNMERVKEFFDLLEGIVVENNLHTARIYRLDETGLTTVRNKPRGVVSRKGRTKCFSFSSGESGVNTTAICCVIAADCCVPPMMIYKWARGCGNFKDWASRDIVFAFNPENSYIQKDFPKVADTFCWNCDT